MKICLDVHGKESSFTVTESTSTLLRLEDGV